MVVLRLDDIATNCMYKSNSFIVDISNISEKVALTFAICHVTLGLKDATCLLNEVLVGIMEENDCDCLIGNANRICSGSIDTLRILIERDERNEKNICVELIDEIVHTKNLNPLTQYLKPKYLNWLNLS